MSVTPTTREEDTEMVLAVRDGDVLAYRSLVERYQERVYHMVYGMVRNQEDARDITQDAFVKAYKNLDRFRLESSFYTWIYRIAMNLAIDHLRKRKRHGETSFDEQVATRDERGGIDEAHHQDNPARSLQRKQLYRRIMDALQQLPEDQRQAMLLREIDGLSYKEIAEIMEIPEGTVMSRLYYARKKLQKLLEEERT
jgi:RNA polymerase sigma-70 factor (ECF subfamily)